MLQEQHDMSIQSATPLSASTAPDPRHVPIILPSGPVPLPPGRPLALRQPSSFAKEPSSGPLTEKLRASHVSYRYGRNVALRDVTLPLYRNRVTAFIGPSGCGKSTLLRVFNRMYDLYPDQHVTGQVFMDGVDILAR